MPFTRVTVPAGMSAETKQAIAHGIHRALVEALGIPEDDFFQLLGEYRPGDFFFDRDRMADEVAKARSRTSVWRRRSRRTRACASAKSNPSPWG